MSNSEFYLKETALWCTVFILTIILVCSPYYLKIYVYRDIYLKNQECRIKLASKGDSLDYIEKICGQIPKDE